MSSFDSVAQYLPGGSGDDGAKEPSSKRDATVQKVVIVDSIQLEIFTYYL